MFQGIKEILSLKIMKRRLLSLDKANRIFRYPFSLLINFALLEEDKTSVWTTLIASPLNQGPVTSCLWLTPSSSVSMPTSHFEIIISWYVVGRDNTQRSHGNFTLIFHNGNINLSTKSQPRCWHHEDAEQSHQHWVSWIPYPELSCFLISVPSFTLSLH